ncbi:MAG: hypothetical protein OCD02_22640 [Spirochaetaceae bacterium]
MKKYRILCLLLLTITFQSFAGDRSEVWSRMYKRSISPDLKYSVMLNIVELNDRGMIPLLEEILSEDIIAKLSTKRGVTEEKKFVDLTTLVIKELGELKSKSSAPLIYNILVEATDPLLKADAIIALGNMRATAYLSEIAFILKNINLKPTEGSYSVVEAESKVAYACIAALDRFRDIEGYSPVFFASVGWYDQRIRFFSDKVLKTIVENPIDALIPIISNGSFKDKVKAINEVAVCKAPSEDKARAAREAMKQGLDNVFDTIQEGMTLTTLRKNAIKVLYASKSSSVDDVYYLSQSIKKGSDLAEKIYAIKTLGVNGSDEALEALASVLSEYNERSVSGIDISYAEEDIIKELIVTLGSTGSDIASSIITEVQFSSYSTGIVRTAKATLKNMK